MPSHRLLAVVLPVALLGCGDDAGLPDARPPIDAPPAGRIAVSWALSHDGAPQSCASVGASSVIVEIVVDGQPFGVTDAFGCSVGMGTTRDLAPGLYNLRITLAGTGNLDGPDSFRGIEVLPDQTTALPALGFDVDPTGSLTFRIGTPAAGGNCAPAAGSAGITATHLELQNGSGTCTPTTFAISAGATAPAATYVADCTATTTACIAADQDVRADGVIAGQHTMILTGLVGTAACWKRVAGFTTRAAGQLTNLNPQTLILDSDVPGCPMP